MQVQMGYKEVEKIYIFNHYLVSANFSWYLSYMQNIITGRVSFYQEFWIFLIITYFYNLLEGLSFWLLFGYDFFFLKKKKNYIFYKVYHSVKGIELSLHLYNLQREGVVSWNHNKLTYSCLYIYINITITIYVYTSKFIQVQK